MLNLKKSNTKVAYYDTPFIANFNIIYKLIYEISWPLWRQILVPNGDNGVPSQFNLRNHFFYSLYIFLQFEGSNMTARRGMAEFDHPVQFHQCVWQFEGLAFAAAPGYQSLPYYELLSLYYRLLCNVQLCHKTLNIKVCIFSQSVGHRKLILST